MVTLGLSVGREAIEPQSERVKRLSLVSFQSRSRCTCLYSRQQYYYRNGEITIFLSGSKSVARLTLLCLLDRRDLVCSRKGNERRKTVKVEAVRMIYKKSDWLIVPMKRAKARGGKGST